MACERANILSFITLCVNRVFFCHCEEASLPDEALAKLGLYLATAAILSSGVVLREYIRPKDLLTLK
jgi:hypothetical protein